MIKKLIMQNQKGSSLIEVIAAIVLISIIFISFFQLVVQANSVAQHNNNRLVLINLADAELERIQAMQFTSENELDLYIAAHTSQQVAGKQYRVEIKKEQANHISSNGLSESSLNLINLLVRVYDESGKKTSSAKAEGYVSIYEK